MKKRYLQSATLAILMATLSHLPAYSGDLRVGVGKVSITPAPADFPFAPSDTPSLNTGPGERSFTGVHDDIYARALVLDDGTKRMALIVLETTAVPAADDLVKAVASQTGIPAENIMVTATHTHSVPLFSYAGGPPSAREAKEIERLKQGAVDAVRKADSDMQTAQVAFGRGQGWVNVNNGEQSGSKAGYDLQGPSDKSLDVIRFTTPQGTPIALLVNYASHAEVMFRSVTRDNGYEVSGDLPGAVSRILEAQPDGAPVVLFTPGAEADQLTLFKSLQYPGRLPAADEGAAGWALLNVQARRLAISVLDVTATLKPEETPAILDIASGSATCPGQQIRIDRQTGQISAEDKPPVIIPLSMIRLNDIVLAGVGGDVASEIGAHFKSSSPMPHSTFLSMTGASVGYIFADASYAHPGHGLTKSLLRQGCAEPSIIKGLLHLIEAEPEPKK
jgi:hypothetical protein